MPIDINVISGGADSRGFLPYVRNYIQSDAQIAPNPINAESVPAMVEAMLVLCRRQNDSIRSVRIFGHGEPGCQFIGSGNQEPLFEVQKLGIDGNLSTLYNQAALTRLRGSFVTGGNVVMHGCNVAAGAIGQKFLEKLSMLWQVSVAASEDVQTNRLSGSLPFNPLHDRIRHVLYNMPGLPPVTRGRYSISYSSVRDTPVTTNDPVTNIPTTTIR